MNDPQNVSIIGLAARLEDEHERDALVDYRRRRNLSEAETVPYASGLEVGAAWAAEAASGAALATAWRLAEGLSQNTIPDLEASLTPWLTREAEWSLAESSCAKFDPQTYASWSDDRFVWRSDTPFISGVIDAAAAVWDAFRRENPERAAVLADPTAPANRAVYLDTLS